MTILAIDPGTTQSAWLVLDDHPTAFGIWENQRLVDALDGDEFSHAIGTTVIEKVESYGMAVGADVFETVYWSGQFAHASPVTVYRLPRRDVKLHLCGSARAKDANIRQALIDRWGGKEQAIGTKKTPGPLYGIAKDVWAALACAITFRERRES